MATPAISIQNVDKFYHIRGKPEFQALKNLNLTVEEGDFFGYLGPNGAGKTTTIGALTGLSNFSSGKIEIFGHDVIKEYQTARKLVGLAQQELLFDPFLSVRQILMYQAGYFGLEGKDIETRVDELLKAFDLTAHQDKYFRAVSGGQKRRMQLAKALVHEPKLLILDEPTEATDTELRHALWKYFRKLNNEGTTIFLTTHYIEEAERLCDRIGIIDKGELVALDSTENLLEQMSEQVIKFMLKESLKEMPQELKRYKVEMNDKKTEIKFQSENAQKELPVILSALDKAGIQIKKMHMIDDRLEDIYLKLTGDGKPHAELDRI